MGVCIYIYMRCEVFGPEKKCLAPPLPKNPQFAADTLPAPRPLPAFPPGAPPPLPSCDFQ